jgi:hypothetical protein
VKLNSKRVSKAIAAWIATFAVIFVAWYVVNYTDYPEVSLLLVLLGIIPIGAYACWQTVPSKQDRVHHQTKVNSLTTR